VNAGYLVTVTYFRLGRLVGTAGIVQAGDENHNEEATRLLAALEARVRATLLGEMETAALEDYLLEVFAISRSSEETTIALSELALQAQGPGVDETEWLRDYEIALDAARADTEDTIDALKRLAPPAEALEYHELLITTNELLVRALRLNPFETDSGTSVELSLKSLQVGELESLLVLEALSGREPSVLRDYLISITGLRRDVSREYQKAFGGLQSPGLSMDGLLDVLDEGGSAIEAHTSRWASLQPPTEFEALHRSELGILERLIQAMRDFRRAAAIDDRDTGSRIVTVELPEILLERTRVDREWINLLSRVLASPAAE
jgi:hypothetical protein